MANRYSPKSIGRSIVCGILEWQVRRLRKRHTFQVVAVAGSIGKTSTKLAIAHSLEVSRRVIYQTGNYNDRVTVPLVFFGHRLPSLFNVVAWLRIFISNERTIRLPNYYDIAVVEIGTDEPGDIREFAYLRPDLAVVTAITEEHMEFFKTLDAVAAEELAVCDYAQKVLVNIDDTPEKYLVGKQVLTYGQSSAALYRAENYTPQGLEGSSVDVRLAGGSALTAQAHILGNQGVKILLAAAATGHIVGLSDEEISKGLDEVRPFAGRMQILRGIHDSTIIDDTYNASPAPVIAALDVLYATKAPQRIAILGSMNELGDFSPEAHRQVGEHCDPTMLDLVVTIGSDAKKYLAPVAAQRGCTVQSFTSPYDAGDCVYKVLSPGAVVLAEGSQNRVFAEESLKPLLADRADEKRLVRQSAYWMSVKRKQFTP